MNKLWVRLALMLAPLALLTLSIVALMTHLLLAASSSQVVGPAQFAPNQIAALENYFATNGSWQGVESLLNQGALAGQMVQPIVANADGQIVAVGNAELVGVTLGRSQTADAVPLIVNGKQVGWVLGQGPRTEENNFLAELTRWAVVIGVGAALLVFSATLLTWIVARPLRNLTDAVQHLAAGELGSQVIVQGTAETRSLAEAFNTMSRNLAEGDALRRRIAADVAHELRTPVSVLRGHLEAMLDGIFPLDCEHLAVVHDQTIYLSKLVDDLRLLTLAEAQRLHLDYSTITPEVLVAQSIEWFKPLVLDAGIKLRREVQADLPAICVDVLRIRQALNNLLTNALRHTKEGGEIALNVRQCGSMIRFSISNSGNDLTSEELSQIFTPFWRSAEAQMRDREGSGLGLAITQQLVTLQGGQVGVQSEAGWTHFYFEIPVTAR